MTKYRIIPSSKFLKDFANIKSRKYNISILADVVDRLSKGKKLDKKHKDHKLTDSRNYKNCRECHISNDWLLVYRIDNNCLLLLLLTTGTHSDLF